MDSSPEGKYKLTAEVQKRIREVVRITPPHHDLYGRRMSIAEGWLPEESKD